MNASELMQRALSLSENGYGKTYPNPIVGNQLSLMLQNIHSGNYDLYLLDMTSRKIPLQNITHSGNDGVIQIKFGNNISKGIYRLVMIGENETLNTPVIIQ